MVRVVRSSGDQGGGAICAGGVRSRSAYAIASSIEATRSPAATAGAGDLRGGGRA
jgi:hypothetical protein